MKNPFKFFFSREESETKVANNRLLSYAAGLTGQNINYSFISQRLFVFLNTVLGIPSETTGLITGISTLWDAVNDPIIGTLIDARKYRPGNKMRPLILYTSPIIGVLTVLMFSDFHLNVKATVFLILAIYLVYDLLYSVQDVAMWGLLALSSPHSEERSRVAQWVSIGAGAGGAIGGLFPSIRSILVDNLGVTENNAYLLGAILFGLGGMLISLLAYRMREKVDYVQEKKVSVFDSLKSLKHNKTLIIICLARFLSGLSLTLPWEYFFDTDGVQYTIFGTVLSGGTMQVIYGLIPGIPGALMLFCTTRFAKKIGGMKNLLVLSEVLQIICRVIAFSVGNNNRFLNFSTLAVIWVLVAIYNIPVGMKDIAHRSLLCDSIDEVELKTGERTEGIAFSMQNFISKLSSAVSKFIQGYMLKFLRFENIPGVSGAALIRAQSKSSPFFKYRWHQFMLGPIIGSALYLITILFLKDDREHVAEVERLLKERRDALEKEQAAVSAE